MLLPVVTEIINLEYSMVGTSVSTSPLIFVIAALFTILTVFISTRKPAKKAAKISPLEAMATEQNYKKEKCQPNGAVPQTWGNRRRSAFIIISLLLCIVLFNSIIIVTQSLDEEKWVNRVTRTDFNVYNSAAFNVMESVQHHKDTLSQQAVDLIAGQPGVEDERYLYRNTKDDRNVLVDYGFEDLSGIELFHEEEGVVNQSYQGYSLYTSSDNERRYFGNDPNAENGYRRICHYWLPHGQTDRGTKEHSADRSVTGWREHFLLQRWGTGQNQHYPCKKRSSWEQKPKRPQAPPPRCISALMLLLYICRTLYLRKSMTLPRC